jgi:hypothetical protein
LAVQRAAEREDTEINISSGE